MLRGEKDTPAWRIVCIRQFRDLKNIYIKKQREADYSSQEQNYQFFKNKQENNN